MKHLLFFLVFLLFISCNKEYNNKNLLTIDLSEGIANKESLNLSTIASKIEYIPLESNQSSWIVEVSQINITSKHIYILDKQQHILFQFNLNGQFKRRIGVKGKGPQEYQEIFNFSVLNLKNMSEIIGITDSYNGFISFYNEKGEFLSQFKNSNIFIDALEFIDDKTIIAHLDEYIATTFNNSNTLNFYNLKGKIISKYSTNNIDFNTSKGIPLVGKFVKYNNKIQYYEPYERILYEVNSINDIRKRYKFDLGKTALPLKKIMTTEITDKAFGLGNIIESDNYIFADFICKRQRVAAFYSKKKKETSNVIFHYDLIDNGFHNDIDGGMPFWPLATAPDGKWISYFYPLKAKKILISPYFDSFKIRDKKGKVKLLDLINRLEEYDNPIIQLTTPL